MTSKPGPMRLIAVFKLLEAISLIVVGVVSLKLVHGDVAGAVAHWAAKLGLDPGNRHVDHALQRAANRERLLLNQSADDFEPDRSFKITP
jgi:hypothetical protein